MKKKNKQADTDKKQKKGSLLAKLTWVVLVGLCVYFYFIFDSFPMFPSQWNLYLLGGMGVVVVITGLLAFLPQVMNTGKILTAILNILLCICLAIASWYLPHIRASIEKAFAEVPTEGEAEINFYVLKDEYKPEEKPEEEPVEEEKTDEEQPQQEQTGTEAETPTEEQPEGFAAYKDKTFIIQNSTDLENQDYAMLVANRELYTEVNTIGVDTIFDAVDRLYDGSGDVMVLNSSYIPMIEDITGYEDFEQRVEVVYTVYKKLQLSPDPKSVSVTTEPFTILIAGNDAYGSKIATTGRTDVNMLATVNPTTKQVSFITIPRDSYVPNACLYNHDDKLTHAGISGIKCTVETLENYLDIDINYYVVINFSSLIKMVDAIGGVDIYNPFKFTSNRVKVWSGTFKKGDIHLDGKMALAYVRERYSLPNGDFDRAMHQTIVIKAMLDKITTPAIVTKVDQILEALTGTFKTNISMDEIYALAQMQLDDMAVWNMVSYSLDGVTGMDYVASLGTKNKYSVVYLKKNQVSYIKKVMKAIRDGEIVEQGKLPK